MQGFIATSAFAVRVHGDAEVSLPALPLPVFLQVGRACLFRTVFGLGILTLPTAFTDVAGWQESHLGR